MVAYTCVLRNKKHSPYSMTKMDFFPHFIDLDSPIHFIQDFIDDTFFFIHINPSVIMRDQGVEMSLDCFFPQV